MSDTGKCQVEDIELALLLEALYQHSGNDFRGYEAAALKGKLTAFLKQKGFCTISLLQNRVLRDKATSDALVRVLHERAVAMFEDIEYQHALRTTIIKNLHFWPDPNVWIPECKNAEEVFELAIWLEEEGLSDKARIFVTCPHSDLLVEAMRGEFSSDRLPQYEEHYRLSGGKRSLSSYGHHDQSKFVFSPSLSRNIVWSQSDIASDASFNEFQFVSGRTAMTEFGEGMRRRSLQVFDESLSSFGILSVDPLDQPNLYFANRRYKPIEATLGLYRRIA